MWVRQLGAVAGHVKEQWSGDGPVPESLKFHFDVFLGIPALHAIQGSSKLVGTEFVLIFSNFSAMH